MNPDELAAIRERADRFYATTNGEPPYDPFENIGDPVDDARTLLAHIDAITEAVEGLRDHAGAEYCMDDECVDPHTDLVARAAVLAILRGER